MIEGESIIYFGPEPWDGLWRNRHQLMRVFARKNKVLYVEPRPFLRHSLRGDRRHRGQKGPLAREVLPNLWVLRSPMFTARSGSRPVNAVTQGLFCHLVRRQLRLRGMSRPIIWLSRPVLEEVLGVFDEKLAIYHAVDEYSAYGVKTPGQKERILNLEKRLLEKADMAVVVSRRLLETKRPLNERTFLIPNGVDFSLFEDPAGNHDGEDPTPPEDIAGLPTPRVGYSGLIGERLDLQLLTHLARRQPTTSFVFIGAVVETGCAEQLAALKALPNVHFLGRKPVEQVPVYLRALDVCLIPYRPGEEARNIDPLKLYDYLACARPVVSVDFPAVEPFADVVEVATGEDAFIAAVETALTDDGNRRKRRLELARANTWEARVEQLSEHIEETLALKDKQLAAVRSTGRA